MELKMSQQADFLQPLLDMIDRRMNKLEEKVDANTVITNKTLVQAKYTNGRVTKLEGLTATKDAAKTAKKFSIPPNAIYVLAVGAVLTLGIIFFLLTGKAPSLGGL